MEDFAVVSQKLIPLSDPIQWQAALQNVPHAFGHTWESCYAMHLTTGYPTNLHVWQSSEAKVVFPLAERTYQGYTDVVTPYGFSGFVGTGTFVNFMLAWRRFAVQTGYVCGYIALNPVLGTQVELNLEDIFVPNRLYVVNLQLSVNELYQKLSQNRKRQLKDFENQKHLYSFDKLALKDFFISNYHSFFASKTAANIYNFSLLTLSALVDNEKVLLIGYTENSQVKAVVVLAYTDYMGEYLFNLSLPGYENQTTPLLWHSALCLKEKGIPYLNLGGGVNPGDSIASFKQRFGPLDLPLRCLKQVYREKLYNTLCEQAKVDPADRTGYFPAYRRFSQKI
ncbi:hypothetical protein [Hymenobacter volaticus]|uniref:GNAT family N-acetyltransferase n=1 Tax=Hymenobacter volaticus TaxID=2932254 RepID=A0ABY4GA02_9BACT|nr:hypothetical protein [Hymenobacter volaticus]UOQ67737.1 hypothetical protein MUN86_07705 [Hymenobacter volaticus]